MEARRQELEKLRLYTKKIDNEVTLILQNLQWSSTTHLLESVPMLTCKYDENHKVQPKKKEIHEEKCLLKCEDYTSSNLLPEPLCNSDALIKLSRSEISQIINDAAQKDPLFKKGSGPGHTEPLSLDRLQCVYTADERRAIHDAVVTAVPSYHDLTDLILLSAPGEEQHATKPKTRMEILAELRNMKRRRTKYRVAAKTKNYSDVLRDVIKTQMEIYTEKDAEAASSKSQDKISSVRDVPNNYSYKNKDTWKEQIRHESVNSHSDKFNGKSKSVCDKSIRDSSHERNKRNDIDERYDTHHKRGRRYSGERRRQYERSERHYVKSTFKYDRDSSRKTEDKDRAGSSKEYYNERSGPSDEGSRRHESKGRTKKHSDGREYDASRVKGYDDKPTTNYKGSDRKSGSHKRYWDMPNTEYSSSNKRKK